MLIGKTNSVLSMLTTVQKPLLDGGFSRLQGNAEKTAAMTPLLPANVTRVVQHVRVDGQEDGFIEKRPKTAFEKISEQGFSQFVAELEAKKLKELREKILAGMRLNEETLAKLPAKQRAVIEKMVAEEIKRRLTAAEVINGGSDRRKTVAALEDEKLKPLDKTMGLGQAVNGDSTAQGAHAGMGMGPLLALQEIDQKGSHLTFPDDRVKPGKKDPETL